jgi:hypothetical protein
MLVVIRRPIASITLCLLLGQLVACESTRLVPVNTAVSEHREKLGTPPGLHVAGYVTRDGVNHPLDATVTLEDDSFVFHPVVSAEAAADTTAAARARREPFRLPRTEVTELNAFHRSHALLVIGACAALAAGLIWIGDSVSGN